MSPVHGNQGQPFGRPAAPSQSNSQWGQQQPQAAQPQPHGYPQGYAQQPAQPAYAPQAAPQGYGQANAGAYGQQPAYGSAGGYGADYRQPAAPAQEPAGGRAPPSYAPQFEPYAPPVAAAPAIRPQPAQPQAYGQPQGHGAQGFDYGTPAAPPAPQAYGQQGYGGYAAQAAASHAQSAPPAYAPQTWGQQPHAPSADPRAFDLGTYSPTHQPFGAQQEPSLAPPSQHEWAQEGYAPEQQYYGQEGQEQAGDFGPAPADYAQDHNGSDLGFGQAAGGELDQGYVDDEAQEYEAEEAPSRFRRPLMMAAVLAGAILAGGGSMYAYKAVFGGSHAGDPPVVKSASQPTKIKPEDGGGKQFAHTDSKIMGRLGDGSAAPDASASSNSASSSDVDANGTRKVATLVVGRDGSIQAPQTADAPAATAPAPVTVPGLTVVDGLGTSRPAPRPAAPAPQMQQPVAQAEPPAAPRVVNSQKVAKAMPPVADAATGSIEAATADEAPAAAPPPAAPKPKKPKVAAAIPAAPSVPAADAGSTSVATTGSGFVAVLASVPRSNSSRMDALKRFADMQQKYAGVLSGKTPDVAEANLGTKGNYHRLVVGPPGSREQANAVCSQLKSQGYADCWVTSY